MHQSILANAFYLTNDAVVILESEGRIIEANQSFYQLFGFNPGDIAQLSIGDLTPQPLPPSIWQNKTAYTAELASRHQDGTEFSIELNLRLIKSGDNPLYIAFFKDITERVAARKKIHHLNQLYEAISASNRAVIFSRNEDEMFARICRACTDYGMKMAWIGMVENDVIIPKCYVGDGGDYLNGIEIAIDPALPSGQGPTGMAIHTGNHVLCNQFRTDPRTAHWHDRALHYGWQASAAFPLYRSGISIGVLTLYSDEAGFFGLEETRLLDELANDISFALDRFKHDHERQKLESDLHASRLQIIRSLGRAGEYRDNDTGAHILRMSYFCQLLADSIGMSKEFSNLLFLASPMHDVGKIGIPDSILLKPGKLESHEFQIMKTHAAIGAEILSDANDPLLTMARSVALTHHEKWDGTGYPAGLRQEEIPIEGRITAICDVYDALSSTRPYKKPWSMDEVIAYLTDQSGKHFDPKLVTAFLSILPQISAIQYRYDDRHLINKTNF